LVCGLIGLYFWSRKEAPLRDKVQQAIETHETH
jgi:hypothetical protein